MKAPALTRRPWGMMAPFFVLLAVFWAVPLANGLLLSFYSNTLYGAADFVGWAHYRELLEDARFHRALRNTAWFMAGSIGVILPAALLLGQGLQQVRPGLRMPLAFVLLLPGLTPPAVLAVLFHLVFHGSAGLLNQTLVLPFGWPPIQWMMDPDFILPALIFQSVWRWTGMMTFFVLAGLEGMPRMLIEAAHLESNSRWRVFWAVSMPQLKPVLGFAAIYLAVDAMATFSGAYVLLGPSGGTADAGLLLVTFIYQTAFAFGRFGTAAAISALVAPVFMALLAWVWWYSRRETVPAAGGRRR